MTDGMGGISATGIRLALECEEIPKDQWKYITQKIITYLSTALNKIHDKPKEGT